MKAIVLTLALLAPCPSFAADPTLDSILKQFHAKQANPSELENIHSIRITGSIHFASGHEAQLVLIKKRPNYTRITLNYPERVYTQAYNGAFIWAKIGNNAHIRLPSEEQIAFTLSAPLFHHLIEPQNSESKVSYLGKSFVKTTPTFHLLVKLDSGHEVEYSLNEQNFQEEKITFNIKDQFESHHTLFYDFRDLGPFKQAFKLENFKGNILDSVININHVEFNVGVLDSYFSPS